MGNTQATLRTRWAAIGAAVAITLGAGGVGISQATIGDGERSVFVPITPCRLADTRPAPDQVGPRSAPLGPNETFTLDGRGTVGDCTLSGGATGLALNVTAVGATQQTNLRFFPAGQPTPTAANLNPSPGAPPTPNAVTVDLADDGRFSVFNAFGSVAVVIDVVGFHEDHHHDDRYYTKGEIDASRTVTAPQGNVGMWWPGATTTATFNSCWRKPGTSGFDPGYLALDALPAGTTILSGTAYVLDLVGTSPYNVTLRRDALGDTGLQAEVLDFVNGGDAAFSLDTHVFELDPPIVIEPGDSLYVYFSGGADRNAFCGFDLTYVLPEI